MPTVYLHYEDAEDATLALTLKCKTDVVSLAEGLEKVKIKFAKKHPTAPALDALAATSEGLAVGASAWAALPDKADVFVAAREGGAEPEPEPEPAAAAAPPPPPVAEEPADVKWLRGVLASAPRDVPDLVAAPAFPPEPAQAA